MADSCLMCIGYIVSLLAGRETDHGEIETDSAISLQQSGIADSCLMCIDNIVALLDGIETDIAIHQNNWSKNYHAEAIWALRHSLMILKFLGALLLYIAKWSDDDMAQDLRALLAEIEAALKDSQARLSADCAEADEHKEGDKIDAIGNFHNKVIDDIQHRVVDAYDTLSKVSHLRVSDYIVFDVFVASVQSYIEFLPLELNAYFDPSRWSHVLPKKFGEKWILPPHPDNDWTSSKVDVRAAAIVQKLETLKSFLQNFERRCIGKEKLQPFLARAGALVFSIAHMSSISLHDRDLWFFSKRLYRAFSELSDKISPLNEVFREIYLGVLNGYVEILKTAKPSPGSVSSLTVEEDVVNGFLTFVLSTKNGADILYDALALPLMDPADRPENSAENLIMFLKDGIEAVVREAGCLNHLICVDEMPKNQVVGTSFALSNLCQKLKLIKAEVFLLELHNYKADLMIPVTDQGSAVVAVGKAMGSLSEFFRTPEQFLEDPGKLMLTFIGDVIRQARSFCNSFHARSITEDVISESSLSIFKLFKAEATLMVLIKKSASTAFLAKYRIESLHKGLILLRALLSDQLKKYLEGGNFSTFVETLASEVAFLICSFGENTMEKGLNGKMDLMLSCLTRMIHFNTAEIKAIYQPNPWSLFSNFPRSDGFGFIGLLLRELRELLTRKPDIIAFMQDQVQVFMEELESVMSLRKDVAEQHNENSDLGTRVTCLIYEAEYIIDLFAYGEVPLWYHQLLIFHVVLETKFIKSEILEFQSKKKSNCAGQNVELGLGHITVAATTPNIDEVIVGVDDQAKAIIDQLRSGKQQLDVVSIVGMPGLGKTTLAKKVFIDISVQHHFKIRGWCCVSQVYRKRELILDILSCFVELTDKIMKMDDGDLFSTLFRSLKGKRFLIVMDDVWTIQSWNELKTLFPDDENGSRVLFTSRHRDVALQAKPTREPHPHRFLSHEESWKLLQERVFLGGSCPEEMVKDGREIARNCKGLPLAIVVVAGLLMGRIKQKGWWKEIAESLRSHILDDPEGQFFHILERSYNNLPNYLKPCFLYLGAFLEDREIPVQKLKLLWIAEGFVPKVDSKSLEYTAENYIAELTGRSLVIEAKRRSQGGTKACRMHDMIRDLCLKKARAENFMQLISADDKDDSKRYYYPSDSLTFVHYRLCVHSAKQYFMQSLPVGPHVHSLLFFGTGTKEFWSSYDMSFISQKFKLLRVLDLECISFSESFPSGIELMFRLSYLAIRGKLKELPSSIAELGNLETLIVRGTHGEISLPGTFWSMARLRHVQIHSRASFILSDSESMELANLATLSSPALSYGKDTEKILRGLIGLKKLRCIFLEHWDNFRKCNVFPVMAFMTHLESLKILYHGRIFFPCQFSFPKNLKKLTLSKFRLPWEYISAIRELSRLEVLKLLSRAFEGQAWDMTEGVFPNLKFLKLGNLNLATWNASSEHFPELERLVLQSCKELKEVPSQFGEIPTLQMIEMRWCSQSSTRSVETIYEQQLNWQNSEFNVIVSPPEWDFRASS